MTAGPAPFRILYLDEGFVAVDKPAGWLSVPARRRDDPRPCVGLELQHALGGRIWPVHRLDEPVSGVLLFARCARSHRLANGWFERRQVGKLYQALTEGDPAGLVGGQPMEWRSSIKRGKRRAYESPGGRPALTRARFMGRRREGLAWELEPLTGRPHQLRVHLAGHGFPVVGDALYGARTAWPGGGIALRAVRLDLETCPGAREAGLPLRIEAAPLFGPE